MRPFYHCQKKAGMLDWLVPAICGLSFLFLVSSIPHWHYYLKVLAIRSSTSALVFSIQPFEEQSICCAHSGKHTQWLWIGPWLGLGILSPISISRNPIWISGLLLGYHHSVTKCAPSAPSYPRLSVHRHGASQYSTLQQSCELILHPLSLRKEKNSLFCGFSDYLTACECPIMLACTVYVWYRYWWTQFKWKCLSRSQRERTSICNNTVFGHPLQSSSSELDFNIKTSFIQLCRKIVWPTQEKVSRPL